MRPPADPPWREFEKLAARIYERLIPLGAEVKHNDHILGRLSGTKRQVDVSIRYEVAGHKFLTIVQARDRTTPADLNAVGEFVLVIEDVGANKGVLICRSGFTPAAQELARSKGVDLCNVHDASSQRWTLEIRVPILWIDLTPLVLSFGKANLKGGTLSRLRSKIGSSRQTGRGLACECSKHSSAPGMKGSFHEKSAKRIECATRAGSSICSLRMLRDKGLGALSTWSSSTRSSGKPGWAPFRQANVLASFTMRRGDSLASSRQRVSLGLAGKIGWRLTTLTN